ncbi:unnamed protein product [Prorocentrum cordatum]|nr:unnamed protein product [Polarella glacialis]
MAAISLAFVVYSTRWASPLLKGPKKLKAAPWLGYTGRVLFGASLLATVAMLYSAVIILMSTSTDRDRSGSGGGGRVVSQSSFSMWFGQDMFAWLMPRPYGYRYYGFGMYGYSYPRGPPPKMSFFESVFSFVFGDGDPNASLGEERWRLLAERIAANGGAVVAEQLAPFLDPSGDLLLASDPAARRRALDRAVLPVLLRFRGEPRVSDAGDIVYVFPELQESRAATALLLQDTSDAELRRRLQESGWAPGAEGRAALLGAAVRAMAAERREAPAFLTERPLRFSQAEGSQLTACLGYGAFSLLATLYLGASIASGKAQILARYYPVMALVVRGFPLLFAYSCTFLGVPLWRWLRLRRANLEIAARNEWRAEQAKQLQAAAGDVARRSGHGISARIREAARWAQKRATFGRAVFDSSRSASEQAPARDLEDFDRRLRGP